MTTLRSTTKPGTGHDISAMQSSPLPTGAPPAGWHYMRLEWMERADGMRGALVRHERTGRYALYLHGTLYSVDQREAHRWHLRPLVA